MTMTFLTSIRGRLLLLVLLLLAPATALLYKTAHDNRELQLAEARNHLRGAARAAALDLQGDIRGAEQMSFALSQLPVVRDFKEPECSALLARSLQRNDQYLSTLAIAADGAGKCSARSNGQPLPNYADREYFQTAMKEGGTVVSKPIAGRITGQYGLAIAVPRKDLTGKTSGVFLTILDLERHARQWIESQPIPGMVYLIWDDAGTLLYRYPDAEKLTGKKFAGLDLVAAAIAKGGDGTLELPGFDGVRRVFGFTAPLAEYRKADIHIGISAPAESLYAAADALLATALRMMAAIALLGIAAAWGLGKRLILAQVESLRESEEKFRGLLESAADGVVICNGEGRIVLVNREVETLFGYSRAELIGQPVELLVPEKLRGRHEHYRDGYQLQPVTRRMGPRTGNCFARRKDGSIFSTDISLSAFKSSGGLLVTAMVRDITARDKAEKELKRLNRTLRMLSQCNEALVRAPDEAGLLQNICSHVVQGGGYRLAWVGMARRDAACSVEAVAHAGVEGAKDYVESLHLTWADTEQGRSATGTAIREGRPSVMRGQDDARVGPWRDAAERIGIAACLSLPLKGRDGVLGSLSISAAEADAFDDEEIKLLVELADDLAYGIVSLRETATRERFERELDFHARFDAVTGLANRSLFLDRLGQTMIHAGRAGRHVAVLLLNLDRFKAINENLGHASGDALLNQIGQRLMAQLREGDTVARLSADEFGVVSDLAQDGDAQALAQKLLKAVVQPLNLQEREVFMTASAGISIFPRDGDDTELLLTAANTAMHSVKDEGGNAFRFFAAEMNQRMAVRFALTGALRRALERGELHLHYQPKVNLSSGEVVGAEVLARWSDAELGAVSPADFIPLAEETGLIVPLGEWALESVCRQMREWLDAGLAPPPVAVNLSARQFRQGNLEQSIREALQRHQLKPEMLELEITESTAMVDVEKAVIILRGLKAIGVKLSIDDFGTGYSSLSYLKRFPIDHLKIDRAFVRDITTDPDDAAICIAVIGLARSMKMTVIAEGVETEGQMNYLRLHRCDMMQGHFFSRPLPAADYGRMLTAQTSMALPAASAGEGDRPTLLLVDDEPNILSALNRLLRRDGYNILIANSAAEGFDLLATHAVQVIISDQRMPEMNGTEFLSRVRELYPDIIRMVLSGYTDLATITEAINRGSIYKFLTKPWNDDEIREQLRAAFRHHHAQAGKRGGGGE